MKTLFLIAVICMVLSQVEGFNSRRYKNADLETEEKLEKLLDELRDLRSKPDENTSTSSEEAEKGSNSDEDDDSGQSNESGNSDDKRRVLKKGSEELGESGESGDSSASGEPDICDELEDISFDENDSLDSCKKMLLVAAKGACENYGKEIGVCEAAAADVFDDYETEDEPDFCGLSDMEQQINAILCVFGDDELDDLQEDIEGWVEEAFEEYIQAKHAKAVRAVANIFKKSFGKRLLV